ncbi:MAG: ADP-dependent glucokinase/phosphofructokinase [Chloroflexota bacterium]|nr:ADP-dependent glucokinase/phosphofructokinase [Chloroflexota bacterium]
MDDVSWEERFAAALNDAEARARMIATAAIPERVACGFSSNVDRVVTLDGDLLSKLIEQEPIDLDRRLSRIESRADCLTVLIQHIHTGQGGELPITNGDVAKWIVEQFPGQIAIGGTGARAANTLARLGFPALLHLTAASVDFVRLLDASNLLLIPGQDGLKRPKERTRPTEPTYYHTIFEYQTGLSVTVGEQTIVAPRANRVITPFDPINRQMSIDLAFVQAVADPAAGVRRVLISGHNQVANETICLERIEQTIAAIRLWRQGNPAMRIHLEPGAAPDPSLFAATLDHLVPHVDSLGLNAEELADVLEMWGHPCPDGIEAVVRAMELVGQRLNCSRLSLHSHEYCLTLTDGDPLVERRALLYGALVAGTHARRGPFPAASDLRRTLEGLSDGLDDPEPERELREAFAMEDGLARLGDRWLVSVPALSDPFPTGTVGLGDSFTAGVLAMLE